MPSIALTSNSNNIDVSDTDVLSVDQDIPNEAIIDTNALSENTDVLSGDQNIPKEAIIGTNAWSENPVCNYMKFNFDSNNNFIDGAIEEL